MTEEPNQQPEQSGDQSAPRLYDLGAALVESSRGSIYCLTIIGQVEGHSLAPNNTKTTKYEHVLPLLAHLEQSEEVDGVLLIPGVEFSTEHGHLLGLFVRQPMVYTTWEETTQAVRRLGES